MPIRVYIDGAVRLPEEAKVSVLDRGFLYGDSVYETIGTMYGRLFAASDHLDRLERSARRIGLRVPPRAEIEAAIAQTIAAAENPETRVRVMLTRGVGKLDLDPASCDDCRLVVIAFPLGAPTPEMFAKGVSVAIVSVTRNSPRAIDPAVKSGNYLNNVLALGEARRTSGAYEAILCADDGSVAEGASSNVFAVVRGEVWTPQPEVGILDGITRAKVMDLGRGAGVRIVERRIQPDELRAADEAFLTSATRGVLPVTVIDGQRVGTGVPGPITRQLMALYDELGRRGVP
ncbi:MAG TPA: aminotransferase class IV [Polyangia bacterium]|nr:aminotransferase class IV [Polyangia bacterium]